VAALALGVSTAQAAEAPQVRGGFSSEVKLASSAKSASAVLKAQVKPGEAVVPGEPINYHFEYATEAAFLAGGFTGGAQKPEGGGAGLSPGNVFVGVSQSLTGLLVDTGYRYRIVATSSAGTATGAARSFTTAAAAPVFSLPDSRGWEMVSPVDKNGGEIQGFGANFGGDVLQAAAAGGAVTYSSRSSFANPQGAAAASQYISRRGGSAWGTDNITPPTESGAYGDQPDGVPFQLFSPDLADALTLDGRRCEAPQPCLRSYSRVNNASGVFTPLPYQESDLAFAGATPDLAHLVFSTCAKLTPDAIEVPQGPGCDPTAPNLYERSGGALRLINTLPGARLAAQSGAVSSDGSHVYFTQLADSAIYLRESAGAPKLLPETVAGGASFQTASSNGSVAFFTRAGTLFRYNAQTEVSESLDSGVVGVLGASDDGSHLYYLTTAGLFLWREATGTSIALAPEVEGPSPPQATVGSYPPTTGTARVSADGTHLAFVSAAEMTSFDNNGLDEVYIYTAPSGAGQGTLLCASCNPSGERPTGPAGLPGASPNGIDFNSPHVYKPRVLSADAGRLFFDSFDSLAPQDTNQDRDVYEWRALGSSSCARVDGCIGLISSGRSEGGASFVDASTDGSDAFFLTDGSLAKSDPGSVDLYDARVGGGFPEAGEEEICDGDSCQPLPPEPEDPTPGSLRGGRPNPPAVFPKPRKRCNKNQVRKHGKCVRKPRHHDKKGGRR
jgi:hypothetical protein